MIRELLLLLHIYLVTHKTCAIDIVTKDFPASIECKRTKEQRQYERAQVSTDNYRACYNYIIDDDDNCIITNPVVEDIENFTVVDSETTLYLIETPLLHTNLYPSNLTCFYVIGKKKNGFVYQYLYSALFTQDLEGLLTMTQNNNTQNNNILQVIGGLCQDFFEFYEKEYDNNNTLINENELVTCGNIPDPRIQFQIDIATTINLVFKSDGQNEFGGVNLYVLEIKPSPNPSKRKKRDVNASPGEQGDIGDTGRKGAPGEPGSTGIPGRNGSEGIKGERGSPGVIGPEGDIGLPGDIGIPGDSGPIGPKGTSCTCPSFTSCEPGIPGKKGSKGSHGDRGPRGHRGEPGPPGPKGIPGEKGTKGSTGPNGAKGLPGPTGDQGLPGVRGKEGPPGPPGLAGCPLPDDTELSRRIREVGHIFATTTELYNSLGIDNKMSADEFYDFIIKRPSSGKDTEPNLSDSDESRVDRNTESSTDCNGIAVVSGPKGDQGVPGLPGNDGLQGKSGIPGINGTGGKAGDPGTSGLQGTKGSHGDKGLRGLKGDEGIMGPPGDSGYCQCYQAQEEAEAGKKTYSLTKDANGIPGRPGTPGLCGQKGSSGSIGETGSPGEPGQRGQKGVKGIKGVTGRTGSNGEPGDKGQLGPQGPSGPTGPPGPPGPPGCVCNNLIILLDKYGFVKKNTEGRGKTNHSTQFLFKPNITCIRNDSGPAVIGPKGEQGLPGFSGASGDPGIPGLPGGDGVPGMKGKHGDPGLYGSNGESGLSGKMGIKGVIGPDGKQGPPGDNATCILGNRTQYLIAVECPKGCPNGLDGAAGEKGDKGLKGFLGFKGYTGLNGSSGQQGVAGLPGLPGDEGMNGQPGVKGPQGIRGLPGAVGPAGPAGPPGPSDSCPEYDGVDFDVFLSASQEDIDMIQNLLRTSNVEVATSLTKKEFPLLRELAKCVTQGYNFTKPKKADCPELANPTNGKVALSKNGKKAQFYCKDGFTIEGEETAVCENGKWSSWLPVCSKTNSITN